MDDLTRRLANGDQAAFAELYDACCARMFHYLLIRLGSRQDAEDVLQETFVRLARQHRHLASVRSIEAYVFSVARNEAHRVGTQRQREPVRQPIAALTSLVDSRTGENGRQIEITEAVRSMLLTLSPDRRDVVELKIYAELTFREIAAVLAAPLGTVATRYRSALQQLRRRLEEHSL